MIKSISIRDQVGQLILALALALPLSPAWGGNDEVVSRTGNISFVSGGVGEDSRERLDALKDFKLKLVFAASSGAYLSSVQVDIADAAGKLLLQTTADGPIFLADLPPGRYRVAASFAGKRIERRIAVAAGKHSARQTLHFHWTGES
jgi:hypothetical protein